MLRALIFTAVGLSSLALGDCAAAAEEYHPWALFEVGSWKKVRVVTETIGADGKVESVSTTDTRTTLTAFDDTSYSLKVDATVEVAGRRFQTEPKVVKQGFYGEQPGQASDLKVVGSGEVIVCGRRFPTQLQEVTVNSKDGNRITLMHFSKDTAPYVLKRETRAAAEASGGPSAVESSVEVLAIDMPYKVLTEIKPVAFVRTIQMQKNAVAISTIEVQCVDVPGAVVSHSSQEFDATGRLVRRSTLELVDFEIARPVQTSVIPKKDEPRRRFFRHSRNRRQ